MENKCEFYDKPREAYLSAIDGTPNKESHHSYRRAVIAKITYDKDTCLFLAKEPVDAHGFSLWRYASFIDPPMKEKTRTIQDGLQYGDVIINNSIYPIEKRVKYKVLGICGDVIFTSTEDWNIASRNLCTLHELIQDGWKLESEIETEPKTVKMTVAEISKTIGSKVEVVE